MTKPVLTIPDGYANWLAEPKKRIASAATGC